MPEHEKINYLEFPCRDLAATKKFFEETFGWNFTDYSQDYTAFAGAGIDGGFFRADLAASTETGSALVVLHSNQLEQTLEKIKDCGGIVIKPIFSFPGGRRFHFTEPSGNEFSVWQEEAPEISDAV